MIAHVAEAGEASGRVVVRLAQGSFSPAAFAAAIRIARAFNSAIECLIVEDVEVLATARFPFAREVRAGGRQARPITVAALEQDMRLQSAAIERRLSSLAAAAEVPIRSRIVRDEPARALAATCADCGPWNVVVLAEPFGAQSAVLFDELLISIADATGLVVVGPRSHRAAGPVILAIEDAEALPGMLRVGERLIEDTDGRLMLALISSGGEAHHWLEAQARLVIGDRQFVDIVGIDASLGDSRVIAESLRRLRGGFMIARFGGIAVPATERLGPLGAALECPLLLVR